MVFLRDDNGLGHTEDAPCAIHGVVRVKARMIEKQILWSHARVEQIRPHGIHLVMVVAPIVSGREDDAHRPVPI